jgi:hypothetical protein
MSVQRVNRTSRLPNPVAFPGIMLSANGGQVFYCCSLGVQDETTADIASMLFTTLGAALGACRANRGDVIYVLPGHTESVTTTPTFVAGVSIIGVGNGDERPTFNWTAASSQWSIAVANVRIANCILNLAATAATVTTKAITIAGASMAFEGCKILVGGAGGTQLVTIGIELTTGADKFAMLGCEIYAPADAAVVTLIKLTNAVDNAQFFGNYIDVGMAATTSSLITFTTAPTNIKIGGREGEWQGNKFRNSIASSTICLTGITATTGWLDNNYCAIEAASGAASAITTVGSLHLGENYGTVAGKYRLIIGTIST